MALIPLEEALRLALSGSSRLGSERLPLEQCDGRVLAEPIVAARPLPGFDYSAMDGYAVRASTLTGEGGFTLSVIGESRAGASGPPVGPGEACRIFTGAPIPEGADAVVIQERVVRDGDRIRFDVPVQPGQNIRRRGHDLAEGVVALKPGDRLNPGRVALAAALDRPHLEVARRPVVAITSTGDELRLPGAPGRPESIPESNAYAAAAIARRAGAAARVLPFAPDEPEQLRTALASAASGADLLVTIGGASVGDHDLVRPAFDALGATFDFWGVAIKPAKPTAVGRLGATRLLCLPGNPASATLAFLLFGVPMLRAMQGDGAPLPPRATLPIAGERRRNPGRQELLRVRLEVRDGSLTAVLPENQDSGAVTSFAAADALLVVPAEVERLSTGDRLPVISLADVWS